MFTFLQHKLQQFFSKPENNKTTLALKLVPTSHAARAADRVATSAT